MSSTIESIIKRVNDGVDATGKEKIVEDVSKLIKSLPKNKNISSTVRSLILYMIRII
jgi:hypothetical protein